MLLEAQKYLEEHQYVTLSEIARHLKTDKETAQSILKAYHKKGCLDISHAILCKTCNLCQEPITFYHWTGVLRA